MATPPGAARVAGALAAVGRAVPNALRAHGAILRQDLRYAARTMNRSRGFALTMVLVTAIGVGANTATFSVADFVLLRPLPFPEPHTLVRLCEGPRQGGGWGCLGQMSPANYRDVTAMTTSFRVLGTFRGTAVNLVGAGTPVRVPAAAVSAQVLPLLGVSPMLGRVFDTAGVRDRDAGSVVLGYGLWQSRFGGDPGVLGKTLRLDDAPYVVIGVMPAGFHFPTPDVELWTLLLLRENDFLDRANNYLEGVGRLRPGVSFERARADLEMVEARLARDHPETNAERGFSFFRQRDAMSPRYRVMLLALCGASLSLLLLTSANLANLLLARAASRERELAVRAALGAGRERLVRQMLTESVLLALLGGAAGVAVATLTVPLLAHLVPDTLPLAGTPGLDLRVLVAAGALTTLTGTGFGLIPALRVGGRTGFDALREGSRGGGGRRQRLRAVLVVVEVAVSVVLSISSGLLIRAVWKVQAVDPGFASEGVLTLRTALPSPRYDDPLRRDEFYDRVLTGVRSLPGVEAAAYTSGIPMVMTGGLAGVEVPGEEIRRDGSNRASLRLVTPGLFAALGVPILAGREVDDADRADRPLVAVVSESFVRRYWSGEHPLGKRFRVRSQERTVVGVVGDIKVRGLERSSEPQLYLPAAQPPERLGDIYVPKDLLIRAPGRTAMLLPEVREIIRQVDPEQPVSDVRLLNDVVADQTASRRAQLRVLGALAVVALLLTGIGIHGLLTFMVAQRLREIGVRLALGAEPRRVAGMVVGEAARLAILGGALGLLAAYGAARLLSALLFGIEPADPLTLGGGVLLVMLVTFAGSLVPALRAVRVSPLVAMRAQ